MSVRFMLDTDDLTKLTPHVGLLATYADLVPDYAAEAKKYPNSVLILIDRGLGDPSGRSSVADIEPGAMTVAQAVAWYDKQHAKGITDLTAYHDRADADAVKAGFGARHYYQWWATLDGTAHITGLTALEKPAVIQCLSASELGYHADGSLVFQDAWHRTLEAADVVAIRHDFADASSRLHAAMDDLRRLAALVGG